MFDFLRVVPFTGDNLFDSLQRQEVVRMIKIQVLNKSYGRHTIIKDSTFAIPDKSVSFFMGPNGAGKTTLIKCLNNLEYFDGEIKYLEGRSSLTIWDDTPFYKQLTGIQNLQIFGEGRYSKKETISLGQKFLNWEILKSKVKSYSYGQRKRLALILVEILKPDILYMDEVTNGLDVDMIKGLRSSILEWSKHMTIILTGHHLDFYEQVAKHVFVIQDRMITEVQFDRRLEDIYDKLS
jgi:ABC-2 type transport system ATP-binding protein